MAIVRAPRATWPLGTSLYIAITKSYVVQDMSGGVLYLASFLVVLYVKAALMSIIRENTREMHNIMHVATIYT